MTARVKKRGNLIRGQFGESLVVEQCTVLGHEILDRNWRIKEGEIDIVSMDSEGTFHFIEVKTRSSLAFGHPFEAITPLKLMRMQRLALAWLATHDCFGCAYVLDIASVLIAADGKHTIEFQVDVL
jgi:putative endonuclease